MARREPPQIFNDIINRAVEIMADQAKVTLEMQANPLLMKMPNLEQMRKFKNEREEIERKMRVSALGQALGLPALRSTNGD